MNTGFTQAEISILLKLVIAHLVSDFLLQSEKGVKDKHDKVLRSSFLYLHILITGLVAWLFLWDMQVWRSILVISVSHLLIDAAKLWANRVVTEKQFARKDIWFFVIDQWLHLAVIGWVWLEMVKGYGRIAPAISIVLPVNALLLKALGYLVVIGPATYMIRFLTKRWSGYLDTREGLLDAGKWIGILERILIVTLVLINQYTAIGFLVAAKSILRLIDRPEVITPVIHGPGKPVFSSRKHTEYVLIGTFLSFGFGILTGLVINWLLTL